MKTKAAAVLLLVMALSAPLAGAANAQTLDPTIAKETLYSQLITPTAMDIAEDGRVIIASREGQVSVWEQDGTFTQAAFLDVDAYDRQGGQYDENACPRGDVCPAGYNLAEGGIHGVLLSPDFMQTGHVYLYYTVLDSLGQDPWPPKMPGARPWCAPVSSPDCLQDEPYVQPSANPLSDEGKFRLSRFTLDLETNQLDLASELPLFENPAEWFFCCHYGGDLEWRKDGTLLMTVGDDTSSDHSERYSPHDQRSDHTWNSAALTSQNVADRRGKVLRIDVLDIIERGQVPGAGVPGAREGIEPNPYSEDPDADPYVYAMGFRSNYRMAYDAQTDYVYVGTVGPDANAPDATRGPAAHDEIEVVPPGGGTNHGWPFCIANNIPYNQYDFTTDVAGAPFDCSGMTPASLYYTYRPSQTSPWLQMLAGSNTALGGVAYRRPESGALSLPAHYDNTFMWMEHSRGQLWMMQINADGSLNNTPGLLLPVAPQATLSNPIDARVGPDGAVYLLEGNGFWNSTSGRLIRFKCSQCLPDPADYGGAEVQSFDLGLTTAAVDGGVTSTLPAWLVAGLVLAIGAFLGIRRARTIA